MFLVLYQECLTSNLTKPDVYLLDHQSILCIRLLNDDDHQATLSHDIFGSRKNLTLQLTLVFTNMVFSEFLNISNKKSRSLQFG